MKFSIIGANQSVIQLNNGVQIFLSYTTPVATFEPGKGYYVTDENHSRTTARHITAFTGGMVDAVLPQEYFNTALNNA